MHVHAHVHAQSCLTLYNPMDYSPPVFECYSTSLCVLFAIDRSLIVFLISQSYLLFHYIPFFPGIFPPKSPVLSCSSLDLLQRCHKISLHCSSVSWIPYLPLSWIVGLHPVKVRMKASLVVLSGWESSCQCRRTQVWSLVREDSTCCRATKPTSPESKL